MIKITKDGDIILSSPNQDVYLHSSSKIKEFYLTFHNFSFNILEPEDYEDLNLYFCLDYWKIEKQIKINFPIVLFNIEVTDY